jgi:hypothetical protein
MHMDNIHVNSLMPGDRLEHGKYYQLASFDNGMFNGSVFKYKGAEPAIAFGDMFNGFTTIGSMVLMANGMESTDWVVQSPPAMLSEGDSDED